MSIEGRTRPLEGKRFFSVTQEKDWKLKPGTKAVRERAEEAPAGGKGWLYPTHEGEKGGAKKRGTQRVPCQGRRDWGLVP